MKKFLFFNLVFISFSGIAQWNSNSSINIPVALAAKTQNNVHLVTDTKRGTIISWVDNRNSALRSTDIYAQRIKNDGVIKWAINGVPICTDTATQKASTMIESDNGSAIITWEDNRAGNFDIYAQKIDSLGNVLWTTNGVAICNKTTAQKSPKIVGDNAGGAIIVWEDSVNFYWDVYAQRISSTGTLLWTTGGIGICTAPNAQINPRIDTDDLGGAIFTWQDKRNNLDYDIYAQRINSAGTTIWTANGVVVCNAVNSQTGSRIEPDGANGALIAWVDKRNGIDYDIYCQRINSSGAAQWTSNGVPVCNAVNNQSALDIKYIGSSGLVLSWKDDRTNTNSIYAQLVSMGGVSQLSANGIKISNSLKAINPNTINDGSGGAIIAWQDSVGLSWNITSQKINSAGIIQWTAGGIKVSNAIDDQVNVAHVTDGNGGAIYAWEDFRNGSDYDIYAHHLYFDGTSIVGINELSKSIFQSTCFPNPISINSVIQLKNYTSGQPWELTIYDAYGRLISTQTINDKDSYSLSYSEFATGIYFYSVNKKNETTTIKGSFISIK